MFYLLIWQPDLFGTVVLTAGQKPNAEANVPQAPGSHFIALSFSHKDQGGLITGLHHEGRPSHPWMHENVAECGEGQNGYTECTHFSSDKTEARKTDTT